MNNELNQNLNQAQKPASNVTQEQVPQTLAQLAQRANEKANAPVDFNSLSPIEKQQLIDKTIKEAEMKCKINRPKAWTGLISTCIFIVILCVVCVIILNTLN